MIVEGEGGACAMAQWHNGQPESVTQCVDVGQCASVVADQWEC